MFDQIRAIYRKSYAKNNDKNNKLEFDEQTKDTLNSMYSNLDQNKNAPDSTLSGIYLTGRYALYKVIESKLINLVTDTEPEYGKLLLELFDDYSIIISSFGCRLFIIQRWHYQKQQQHQQFLPKILNKINQQHLRNN